MTFFPTFVPNLCSNWLFNAGEMKQIVAKRIGLDLVVQRLLFRGKEQEDEERLHLAGIKDNSKVVVLEDLASKEKKLEQSQESEEVSKASEAVAGVRAEVDKLSKRVTSPNFLIACFVLFLFDQSSSLAG